MSRERGRGDWRIQRVSGGALILTTIVIAGTREQVSEGLVGTLLAFGVLLVGVPIPKGLPFVGRVRDEEEKP